MLIIMGIELRTLGGLTAPIASPALSSTPFTDPSLLDSETDKFTAERTLAQSSLQTQKQTARYTTNDTAIAQREREINDIASGIIELSDIFKDLSTLVIDQGTMLDRIDYNIENMRGEVKEAEKELVVAGGYQRRYVKRKIMFLLALVILGLVVLLGIKGGRKGGGGGDGGDGRGGAAETGGDGGEQRADPIGTLEGGGPRAEGAGIG